MSDDTHGQVPPEDERATESVMPQSPPPERIGRYRILQKIGEGGMGEIYLAEQDDPRRKVALKIIKWGMDTKPVIARFEAERQALALMDHPNIAKVFDAGATEQGRPYFVMEYVKGVPITEHCDTHRLTTKQRLELFIHVCEGVQHAHQKAVIHRDLKPSNVLVAIQDGEAVPKIIDFGVAKATAQRLTEKTMFTAMGVIVGTPEYMSPEQADLTSQDIDTRTDVYSLGAVLYELLVGVLPFDPQELRRAGFDEIRRRIREDDPSKPSTRINTLGESTQETVTRRRTDLTSLQKELQDDLDWIAMRALEKDRTRRYGSASELAADITRHLQGTPVVARPPSASYRLRKFVGRHRVGVTVGALLVALLIVGTIGTSIGLLRAVRAENDARREAAVAEQVSEFLIETFSANNPLGESHRSPLVGPDITAGGMLESGVKRVRTELAGQPLIQSRLMGILGATFLERGETELGAELMSDALEIMRTQVGNNHPETAEAQVRLAHARYHEGANEEAETLIRDALRKFDRAEEAAVTGVPNALGFLEMVLVAQGRSEEAEQVLTQRREIIERNPDSPASARADVLLSVAGTHIGRGELQEAETLYLKAIEILETAYGSEHVKVGRALSGLANLYTNQGRYDEAVALGNRAMAMVEQFYGKDHIYVVNVLNQLSGVYSYQGRFDLAAEYGERAVEIMASVYGADSPTLIYPLHNLAYTYMRDEDLDRAEETYLRGFDIAGGVETIKNPIFLKNLATTYYMQGRYGEAEELFERALAIPDPSSRYYWMVWLLNDFTPLRIAQSRYGQAEELNQRAIALARDIHGDSHPDLAWALHLQGLLRTAENRDDDAEVAFRNALAMREVHLPADSPDLKDTRRRLFDLLQRQGRTDEANALMAAAETAEQD